MYGHILQSKTLYVFVTQKFSPFFPQKMRYKMNSQN